MSSKKIVLLSDFAAGVYLSEAQNPIPPPLNTVYVCTANLFTQGRGEGGRVEPERRGEGATGESKVTKLGCVTTRTSIQEVIFILIK
jgi:hypothetical protein